MSFVVPIYNKSKVNLAGDILSEPDRFDEDDVYWAWHVLTNWRASHAYPINTFQATLRSRLKNVDVNALVAQRLKRAPSVIKKLCRFKTMNLSQMQDIGGLRGVLESIAKVRTVEKQYRDGRLQHSLVSSKDYIAQPKSDGYRGVHLVFRYKNDLAPEYDGLHIELQLRTKVQHSWATAVETMETFLGQALKSGQGEKRWREFFSVTGSALALDEKMPPVPGYERLDRIESYQKVAELESQLGVLEKLRGFSIAADQISEGRGQGSYHLIVLDSNTKAVNIQPYPKNRLDQASNDYAEIEKRIKDGERLEAVLVSAGPVEALKRAYPNYFLDTHGFIRKITKMVSDATVLKSPKKGKRKSVEDKDIARKRIRKSKSSSKEFSLGDEFDGVRTRDIPQADDLDSIREVLEVVGQGKHTAQEISDVTGYSMRHVYYKIAGAEILGCVQGGKHIELTPKGRAWIRRIKFSEEEARFLRALVEETVVFRFVVPDIFESDGPDRAAIVKRLTDFTSLSLETALRRASTLAAWANRIQQCQLPIELKGNV